jgi:chromosome segregation ATPase
MLAWVQEGQHVLQHVLPAVLDERDTLRNQLDEAARRCKDLQQENDGLRAEIARVSAAHQQLAQGQAGIADSVEQFLTQVTSVLEPMRSLAERIRQPGPRRDNADHAG